MTPREATVDLLAAQREAEAIFAIAESAHRGVEAGTIGPEAASQTAELLARHFSDLLDRAKADRDHLADESL
ncbi:MAG TPA: hypothetical protein VFB90_01125 [Dehalococcoidia bacterium]|nr:hypothetical protein [Dehalococcoidia bacterium]